MLIRERYAARRRAAATQEKLETQRSGYEQALGDVRAEEREYREKLKEALDACQANAQRLAERLTLLDALMMDG
jgi:hypothetical protein